MDRRPLTCCQDLLDELQIRCIGLITAEWALLEVDLSIAIWDFCSLDRERGHSVTADLSSLAKIKMVRSVADVHFSQPEAKTTLNQFRALFDKIETLNSERNIVVHSLWLPDANGRI